MNRPNLWSVRHKKDIAADKSARWKKLAGYPITFIVGSFFGLFFNQWVAPLLPGPSGDVRMLILRGDGSAEGCTGYVFQVDTDETIDSAYIKLSLPQNIKDSYFGFPSQFYTGEVTVNSQMWMIGKVKSECAITQVTSVIGEKIPYTATGNVLTIRTSKMAGKSQILGLVVVSTLEVVVIPKAAETLGVDSEYEYTKWGLSISGGSRSTINRRGRGSLTFFKTRIGDGPLFVCRT
jgi:hypothetical protein